MNLWGALFFILSQIGFAGILRMAGIDKYLSWITSIVIQTLLLYILAMVGLLSFGIRSVVFVGCLFFLLRLIFIVLQIGKLPFEGIHYFDVWMVVIGLTVLHTLSQSILIHYDNYSHWAIIVKYLLTQGHLPIAGDSIISFTSYPPATALWITEFVSWVGFNDGTMLVAQFLLIWASLYALFAVLRDRTRSMNGFFLCFIIAIINVFNIAIRMNNLLVDFVLPVVTAAGFAGIYAERKHPLWQCSITALFSAELLLVKNSGTMYVVMLVAYLLYSLATNREGTRWQRWFCSLALSAVTAVIGFLPFFWWNQHVHNTFTTISKHQISAQAYQQQLHHEGNAVVIKIGHRFLDQILNWHALSTRGVLLINAGLLIGWIVITFLMHHKNPLLKTLFAIDVSFLIYYGSVFAMYLVSMPYAEAIQLDGLERYLSSMVILNLLLGAMVLAVVMDQAMFEQRIGRRGVRSFKNVFTKNLYQLTALVLMIFSTILMFSEINGIEYNNTLGKEQLPVQLKQIAQPSMTYNHRKILLVDPHTNDVNNYYAGYVGRYYFFSDKVVGQENFMMDPATFKKTVAAYQYVALPEWHRTFTVMLQKTYHQSYKTGLYRVTSRGLRRVQKITPVKN